MQTIPCDPSLPAYEMQVALGDDRRTFTLRFHWNGRESAWYFDLMTEGRDMIRASIKIVVNVPLAFRLRDERRPRGVFFALDTSGGDADPGIADLGARVAFAFVSSADLRDIISTVA